MTDKKTVTVPAKLLKAGMKLDHGHGRVKRVDHLKDGNVFVTRMYGKGAKHYEPLDMVPVKVDSF